MSFQDPQQLPDLSFPAGTTVCHTTWAALIAALRATNSVWKRRWPMKRSATERPLAMTKTIEPASSVGNGLEVAGQAPFEATPARSLAERVRAHSGALCDEASGSSAARVSCWYESRPARRAIRRFAFVGFSGKPLIVPRRGLPPTLAQAGQPPSRRPSAAP